ncbi:MAG: type I restriction endonuclease subunit S [Verrucomicrobia bacterium]|nr:type I restriction endonuclease subunit S [Verrucomicrobiota bacterium]
MQSRIPEGCQRRERTRALQHAMMQELFTGETRLIDG